MTDWWRRQNVCWGCQQRCNNAYLQWVNYWSRGVYREEHLCPACARERAGPGLSWYLEQHYGTGNAADEEPEVFDVAAIRLASHLPEPDADDDIPGWGLASRLGAFLNPALSDTLEGISSPVQEFQFGARLIRRKGGAASPW